MMKTNKKMQTTHRLAAAVTAGMIAGSSTGAFAGAVIDANKLMTNIVSSSKSMTDLINLLGYIGGSGLAVAGIFKLKQHVDNPGQTPLKDGVMRLAAGGALLSVPFMTQVMQGSISQGDSGPITAHKVSQFQ